MKLAPLVPSSFGDHIRIAHRFIQIVSNNSVSVRCNTLKKS
jgi:hypothetical protein